MNQFMAQQQIGIIKELLQTTREIIDKPETPEQERQDLQEYEELLLRDLKYYTKLEAKMKRDKQ